MRGSGVSAASIGQGRVSTPRIASASEMPTAIEGDGGDSGGGAIRAQAGSRSGAALVERRPKSRTPIPSSHRRGTDFGAANNLTNIIDSGPWKGRRANISGKPVRTDFRVLESGGLCGPPHFKLSSMDSVGWGVRGPVWTGFEALWRCMEYVETRWGAVVSPAHISWRQMSRTCRFSGEQLASGRHQSS